MNRLARYRQIIQRFPKAHLLVVGDVMLDEFIWGEVSRISPEAPVPVVVEKRHSLMPGGAANVAHNVASLGGKVTLCGIVGCDETGRQLKALLGKKGISVEGLVSDPGRPTTLKTRVIAHHQQVVRLDREQNDPLPAPLCSRLISFVNRKMKEVDAVILEDYGKGVVTPPLILALLKAARQRKVVVAVDPKKEHLAYYKGVTVITPNRREAYAVLGEDDASRKDLSAVGKALLKQLDCRAVLITLGEDGMSLFEKSGAVTKIPTVAQEVFDVSGAGDTVIGTLALALAAGALMAEAAWIANHAAGIVVGKVGVAVTDTRELLERMTPGR